MSTENDVDTFLETYQQDILQQVKIQQEKIRFIKRINY